MIGFLSVFVDAWEQLKLQRVRVLMSLIGVTLAVSALTASLALGNVMTRVQDELSIRYSGPEATYAIYLGHDEGGRLTPEEAIEAFDRVTDRYSISYATSQLWFQPEFASGNVMWAEGQAVDPAYFDMHGRRLTEGRLLLASDAARLAPVAVVTQMLADELGVTDLRRDPVVTMRDGTDVVVVGILADINDFDSVMYVLPSAYLDHLQAPMEEEKGYGSPLDQLEFRIWVPAEQAADFARAVVADLRHELAMPTIRGDRIDAGAYSDYGPDPATITQLVLVSVSVAILALGALSLINIAVVTVRYRIREFGIRRAFGASQRRIFIGVIMESVVGTFVAGVVGVGIVTVLYRGFAGDLLAQTMGLAALPAFPFEAAVIGIVVSIGTGAVAGLIPALIAVGSKVIDAIRF